MPSQITPFHSSRPPAISVKSYLEDRILKYAGCSEETFILALIYMDQVVQFNPDFVISSLNVHRLLITSIMLASKFFDDVYYNNAYYARVGGISNSEVNSLEMEMLRMISFSLFVQPEQYERYRGSLYSHVKPLPTSAGGLGDTGAVSQLPTCPNRAALAHQPVSDERVTQAIHSEESNSPSRSNSGALFADQSGVQGGNAANSASWVSCEGRQQSVGAIGTPMELGE